ncbi:uncharacterized protein [Polyergus mexicanus]|uniref:uncharacterized protein n=1 Tax=Polyergus mexicanus TaxID=615972 RepID=UPI0038B4DD26
MIAYVPNYKVIRQFIIRGVDDDDSPEDLIKNVCPPPEWNILWQPPFEAVRLKKPIRTRDSKNISSTKYTESDTYVVRFRTLSVPPSVIYMGKRCYLTPFIEKVRRCQRCQRFGHVARFCRASDRNAVCQRCGKLVSSHDSSNNVNEPCSAESPSCINCKRHKLPDNETVHEASSNSCPIFQKQRRIKKLMAFHGISQSEAMSMLERADPQSQQAGDNYTRSHPLPTLGEFLPYALPKSYAEAVSRNNHASHFNLSIPSSEVSVKRFPSIVKPQFSTDGLPAKPSINRKSQDVGSQHKRPRLSILFLVTSYRT